jgi:hypothetical protein
MTTEPAPPRTGHRDDREARGARGAPALPLDSTAELLVRITAQLSAQLGRVTLTGTRDAPRSPAPA